MVAMIVVDAMSGDGATCYMILKRVLINRGEAWAPHALVLVCSIGPKILS
jgi:hypothetical protein